jgi:hypothetical protein
VQVVWSEWKRRGLGKFGWVFGQESGVSGVI